MGKHKQGHNIWPEVNSMSFATYQDTFKAETDYRANIKFDDLCTYGIKPLDDSLLAIARNELIVIAASSGYGKSEAAIQVSEHNAMNGKRVALYGLEGGSREVIQRMKWKRICEIYYREYSDEHIELDYRAWVLNKVREPLLTKIEAQVYVELTDKIGKNLYLYDNPAGLNCKSFCQSLQNLEGLRADLTLDHAIRKSMRGMVNLDLIVIDHLHYFSIDKDENEIAEITEILKTVKIITEEMQIPVILVAHLRKLPRGHGIPDKEDIYGTSNIHKIANTCIIIAPDHEKDNTADGLYPTYFRIAKSRQGLRPNILMQATFDIHSRSYQDKYDLYRCFANGEVGSEPIPYNELPSWARPKTVNNYTRKDFI